MVSAAPHNDDTVRVSFEGLPRRLLRCLRAGYTDGRGQRAYAEGYDDWREDEQLAYESGRFWATAMRAARVRRPAWGAQLLPPEAVTRANARAYAKIGDVVPSEPLPPDDQPLRLEAERPVKRHPLRRRRRLIRGRKNGHGQHC
jgi:hypothetical protein